MSKLTTIIVITPLVVILDQFSKWWVTQTVELGQALPVIDGFFSITHVLNRGIVFGFFQGGYIWLFLLLTVLAMALIVSFYRQLGDRDLLAVSALGLILGGAVGNGIDRVFRAAVVDFLHFDFGWFVYPDFNIADSGIVVGVLILLAAPQVWDAASSDSGEVAATGPDESGANAEQPAGRAL